jgi:sec-independent protein translocase protein TatB
MFDIGFTELLIIAVIALIVIGPERLPKVARTLGHLFGRMQRYVNDVKADITREMELEELRKLQTSVEDAARSMQDSVSKGISETESELNKVAQAALPAPDYPETPAPAPTLQPAPDPVPQQQLDLALDPNAPSAPKQTQSP